MILKECFEKEWIDKVCSSHKFKHPELVEKVVIQYGLNKIEKYSDHFEDVKNMTISPVISKDVAKIRRGYPEAFYYWSIISQILQEGTQTL